MVNESGILHKHQILKQLKSEDRFFSGEELSKEIGISRVAIRKHILQLKEKGYHLETSRSGYHFSDKKEDFLYDWEFRPESDIHYLGNTDSTMNEARRKAEYSQKDFTIVSGHQESGKDLEGNIWNSPEGGLYITRVSYLSVPVQTIPVYPLYIQSILAEYFRKKERTSVKIIWPSRFETKSGIIGGILCEHLISGCQVKWSASGIGIKRKHNNYNGTPLHRKEYLKDIDTLFRNLKPEINCESVKKIWFNTLKSEGISFGYYLDSKEYDDFPEKLNDNGILSIKKENRIINLYPDKL